ncbi:MAG: SH3 domain-containing protein [Lachnospiraceae bacterium]|nr:SH3 domain-containing protein [Lachnospiraceae bacterium]
MANKNRIQEALGEARENLILGKYNDAMMLMAQITMDVIEHITDEALIVSGGYEEDLKTLRANGIIADDTAHNFETLIISGVQAHNGVDIPKEHAEQALQVLTNELDVIFKNEDINPTMTENLEEKSKFDANAKEGTVFEYDEDEEPYAGDFSKDMTVEGATPAFMQKDSDDFRTKERIRAQMLENETGKKTRRNKSKLIAIIIPIALIVLLIFIVRGAVGLISGINNNSKPVETTTTMIETTEPTTTVPVETEPPTPPEAGYYRVTGDLVKIRDAASTENSKVLTTVSKDATVMVKQFYNNDWAIIAHEGRDAYISRKYIKRADDLNARTSED